MMVTGRLTTIAGRCAHCRFNTLHAFAFLAGISLPPPSSRAIYPVNATSSQRSFSTSIVRRNETQYSEHRQESAAEEVARVSEGGMKDKAPQQADSSLPWYLQVAGPPKQQSPLPARQQLPPIPEDSPELLLPFLEHLSENIGLDDLVLLDLRALDPPPALGAKLMMVVGTARSEKHLHVSADRFCRWLRTNYKLSPYADGLLGRNELKLKMRRKARRIKLLSSVGSVEDKNADDGIRTGWICVNVGSIESGEQELDNMDTSNGFVGFGGTNNGATLVVQMMTEEKREELDLETLWGGAVARQKRKEAREAKGDDESVPNALPQVGHALSNFRSHADASRLAISLPFEPGRFNLVQQRNLYTTSTRPRNALQLSSSADCGRRHLCKASLSHSQHENYPTHAERNDTGVSLGVAHSASSQYPSSAQQDCNATGESELEPQIQVVDQVHVPDSSSAAKFVFKEGARVALASLVKHLDRLPSEDARRALGRGPQDECSTSFLQTYYLLVQCLLENQQVRFRIKAVQPRIAKNHPEYYRALLLSRGVAKGHPEYTKQFLLEHLHDLQMSGSIISIATYAEYISGLAIPDYEVDLALESTSLQQSLPLEVASSTNPQTQKVVTRESLDMILEVLEDMHLRGISIAHKEILSTLCEALARSQFAEHDANQPMVQPNAVHELTQIMFRHRLPVNGIPYYEHLLECFANAGNWAAYWKCWRGMARRTQQRSFKLYQNLFRHIANTGNQRMCIDALREWIPEMEREEPSVRLQGDRVLIYEITRCLRIADPRSEQRTADGEENGEWVRLWLWLSKASRPVPEHQGDASPDAHLKKPGFYNPSITQYRFENRDDETEEEDSSSQWYALKT